MAAMSKKPPSPPPWDLLVIGGGTAGIVGAKTAANLGARVLLVECHRTGGDCLWTGCVPSKSLLAAASAAATARGSAHLGVHAEATLLSPTCAEVRRANSSLPSGAVGHRGVPRAASHTRPGRGRTTDQRRRVGAGGAAGTPRRSRRRSHRLRAWSGVRDARFPRHRRGGKRTPATRGRYLRGSRRHRQHALRRDGDLSRSSSHRGPARDRWAGVLLLDDGEQVSFDRLLVAVGRATRSSECGDRSIRPPNRASPSPRRRSVPSVSVRRILAPPDFVWSPGCMMSWTGP